MKQMKKWFAALLVLAMLCVMGATALAAETGYSIAIANGSGSVSIDGNVYYAYKLFNVVEVGNNSYTYAVNDAYAGFTYTADGKTYSGANLVAYAAAHSGTGDLNVLAGAALSYTLERGIIPAGSDEASNEAAQIELSDPGYYLVSCLPAGQEKQSITALVAVTANDPETEADEANVRISIKAEVPAIDKDIVDPDSVDQKVGDSGDWEDGTAVDVGSKVEFKLYSKVPVMTGYTSYTYTVHDEMSEGLTPFDGDDADDKIDVSVTIGGVAYTGFTINQNGQSFEIVFNNFIEQKDNEGKEIVITYAAILNSKAESTNVETNKAELEYSNNPSDSSSTGKTPEDTVYVYDFEIVIHKQNNDKAALEGAKFVLYKQMPDTTVDPAVNVNYYYSYKDGKVAWYKLGAEETLADAVNAGSITELTTAADGQAKFVGLDAGTYFIHETAAPAGYKALEADVEVEIETSYRESGELDSAASSAISINTTIINTTGSQLPATGGMGTTVIYIAGGALVLLAVVLLILKKRSDASK